LHDFIRATQQRFHLTNQFSFIGFVI
jgi:hypothetical protein